MPATRASKGTAANAKTTPTTMRASCHRTDVGQWASIQA